MSDLLPCPFCGSVNVSVRHVRDGAQAFCRGCGASATPTYHGPNMDTYERAVAAWNTRAAGRYCPPGTVLMPQSVEEARAMNLISEKFMMAKE